MTCIICRRKIGRREPCAYALVKPAAGRKPRKIYACMEHQEAFDEWLDSRAVDDDGAPLEHKA